MRATCRANEVAVDPALLGGGSVASDTLAFPPETAIGGTATLYIAPTGINQDEPDARTPVAGGTLRSLR